MRLLPLLLFVAASFAQSAPAYSTSGSTSYDEQQILVLVNRERQSRGLSPLVSDPKLQQAARQHSQRMAAVNTLGHQLPGEPDLSLRRGHTALRFDVNGENVAVAADAPSAHDALMHSPHHRANILDTEYNSIGIGVVQGSQGIFVTQDFARLLPRASVDEAEEQVALRLSQGRALRRIAAPELRSRACEMAARDQLNPHAGFLPRVSNAIAFTAEDLTQLPESLRKMQTRSAGAFSVGACYRSSASYENPVFWFLVVTYQ